jgi:hypothetical protein
MKGYILGLAVAFSFLSAFIVPATAKVPSFALWSAREKIHQDQVFGFPYDECTKDYVRKQSESNDAEAGKCVRSLFLKVIPGLNRSWEHGLSVIAKPQNAACKKAIHAYYVASTKDRTAKMAWFRSQPNMTITDVIQTLGEEPYKTLNVVKEEKKSAAIRVCG